jgi:hypothetical protein
LDVDWSQESTQEPAQRSLVLELDHMEEKKLPRRSPLMELERQVLAEGREWTRQRLQQRLQALAEKDGELSPPQRPAPAPPQAPDADADDHGRPGSD